MSSEHLGNIHCPNKLRGRKQPKIVVKGLHNADCKNANFCDGVKQFVRDTDGITHDHMSKLHQ